jgi:hypothetical protein
MHCHAEERSIPAKHDFLSKVGCFVPQHDKTPLIWEGLILAGYRQSF